MENIPTFEEMPQRIATLTGQIEQLSLEMSKLAVQIKKSKLASEPEAFIGIDEACALVHLAKPTIYKLAQKSLIPFYKPAKELLFRRTELIRWVEESGRLGRASIDDIAKAMTIGNRRKATRWDSK